MEAFKYGANSRGHGPVAVASISMISWCPRMTHSTFSVDFSSSCIPLCHFLLHFYIPSMFPSIPPTDGLTKKLEEGNPVINPYDAVHAVAALLVFQKSIKKKDPAKNVEKRKTQNARAPILPMWGPSGSRVPARSNGEDRALELYYFGPRESLRGHFVSGLNNQCTLRRRIHRGAQNYGPSLARAVSTLTLFGGRTSAG